MNKKSIILIILATLIVGGAVYVATSPTSEVRKNKIQNSQAQKEQGKTQGSTEPSDSASNDQIIDYIVDSLGGLEANASIETLERNSFEEPVTIQTNF